MKSSTAYLTAYVESDIVESYIDIDLAGEIAESIDGINNVENDLEVDKSKADTSRESDEYTNYQGFRQTVLDATLAASVTTNLLFNSNTSSASIDVDADDGLVTLSGEVASDEERELAQLIATNTNGTQSVENLLTIKQVATI